MSGLPRILEPEVMESEEEAAEYDAMDHGEVNRLFVDRLFELGAAGQILDVGTGPAQMLVDLCRRSPRERAVGLDAAHSMLSIGRRHLARAGLLNRALLVRADAKRLPFPDRSFDAVMSNSIMHHLPDPTPCLKEIARVLKPAGVILLRDLHRPADLSELDALVEQHAAGATDNQRKLFRDSLHASFTCHEMRDLLRAAGLQGLSVYRNSDRHWTAECRSLD